MMNSHDVWLPLVTQLVGGTSGMSAQVPNTISTCPPVKPPNFTQELEHTLYHNQATARLKNQCSSF